MKRKNNLFLENLDNVKRIDYKKKMKRIERIIIGIIAITALVFLVIAGLAIINEGLSRFIMTISSINLYYYALALIVVFCGYALRYPKWSMYIKMLGIKLRATTNFLIYLSMYSMEITPGRWGRAVVSYSINRLTGAKFGRTFPAVVADIFTDFLGFIILAIFFAFFLHKYMIISLVISAILLLPFVFLYHRKPFMMLKAKLSRFSSLKSFFAVGDLYFKSNNMLEKKAYGYSLLFTVPAMFLNGLALYIVILAFGVQLGLGALPAVIFIFSTSLLFGMITGLPGNVGVTDAAMLGGLVFFFGSSGVSFGLASAITIFYRIATVWFVEGFGFVALAKTFSYWR
ncbi:MAG: lysylphosphatidylglycerol synthase transmembrane domain-containing protein [Candidatus Micrarchaeaceae archaeon]